MVFKNWPYWLRIGIFLSVMYVVWIVWVIIDTKIKCSNLGGTFTDFCIFYIFRADFPWSYFMPISFFSGWRGFIFPLINFALFFSLPFIISELLKTGRYWVKGIIFFLLIRLTLFILAVLCMLTCSSWGCMGCSWFFLPVNSFLWIKLPDYNLDLFYVYNSIDENFFTIIILELLPIILFGVISGIIYGKTKKWFSEK